VIGDWKNCAECHQAREARVLDEHGVCPWCNLTVIRYSDNPLLPATAQQEEQQ
jgi:hypothetical protein